MEQVSVALSQVALWLKVSVFAWATLGQAVAILLLTGLTAILTRHANHASARAALSEAKLAQPPRRNPILQRLRLSPARAFFMATLTILLWLSVALAQLAGLPSDILHIAASLALAWCVIRFGAGLIKSEFWAEVIAVCIGIVAGLEIIGLLRPLLDVLDHVGVSVGKQRYSLLLALKGILAATALLWGGSILNDLIGRALQKSKSITPSQKVMLLKVTRIVTITLALLIGLNAAGIDLTVLAVFGGAIGIGVGFGLQRIFANLVSGFILLLDRSIKPGDVISVMDTYGWVNRLGARYVSILTRDGKEHLIPNEKLITEQVENWSYSDDKVRVHIPVTVSYATNIHAVKDILLEAATSNPRILPAPKPVCLLLKFGESGVEFDVRVWIRDPVNGIANVRSSFYFAIWDKFREHGITFPVPQRDVNLKLEADLKEALLPNGTGQA